MTPPTTSPPTPSKPRWWARAVAAVADKVARGIHSPEFLAQLSEPLEIRPDPAFAAGPSWHSRQIVELRREVGRLRRRVVGHRTRAPTTD